MAVVEDLTEDEAYLWAILSDPSGLDIAEFAWFSAEEKDGCFRAWPFQWRWWRNVTQQQIDQCFPGDTLVTTRRGQVHISEVVAGDEVLTHENRWRPVTYLWNRGEQETVVLKGHGHGGLEVTSDHSFYLNNEEWRSPEVGDRWASPSEFPEECVPDLPERTYAPGRPDNIPNDVTSPTFMWLYGLFLAEGSISSSFGKNGTLNRVTYSVHTDEVAEVESKLTEVGLRFNTHRVASEECFNIVINSRPLATWLCEHGGKGAKNKSLASWVLGLEEDSRAAVLAGAMFGDGYKKRGEYVTVSKALAVGIKLLGQSLGFSATLRSVAGRRSQIDGREIVGGQQFVVGLCKTGKAVNDGHHYWSEIKEVTTGRLVRCYDIEVEEDHSFVADGIVVSNCARSVGKSLSIQVRAFAFPFIHPGQEMVITAPEGNHLDAITDNVETRFINTRLGAEMLVQGRSGVKHRPFHMNFANGSRIMGRIPQRDGKGVKGIHPIWLELDEAQDYPDSGWTEIIETLKQGSVGAVWRAHGVTRGMRDFFYKFTQPDSGWHIHQLTAMHRPTWSDEERQSKIQSYGSRDHPDYRRNVLGLHGDATNPLFVLHRLMQCVDSDNESNYNLNEYTFIKINNEMVLEQGDDILPLLDFPQSHMKYKNFWIGMDVGYTNHPSELVVFGETKERAKDSEGGVKRIPANRKTALKLLSRIRLERISHGHQVNTILWLVNFYKPHAFAMDKTGLGLPLFQDIQERAAIHPEYRIAVDTLKGYNFSGKILVDFDSSVEVDEYRGDIIQDSGIQRNVLEYSSDRLRAFVDDERIILPNHTDMIREFQGQTWVYDKSTMDMYGRKKVYSKGSFHVLDATRMAVLGFAQNAIEEMTKAEKHETVPSIFLY